ncbi:unnamed protein product [Nezara viridula]|uniref:Uncharacterized protein n=1 Tax=Nezara viridula TaxID=85310 RepID=A0A9P0E1K4_NEZVI|nr:unnamed protein product [Nezara viridula]
MVAMFSRLVLYPVSTNGRREQVSARTGVSGPLVSPPVTFTAEALPVRWVRAEDPAGYYFLRYSIVALLYTPALSRSIRPMTNGEIDRSQSGSRKIVLARGKELSSCLESRSDRLVFRDVILSPACISSCPLDSPL